MDSLKLTSIDSIDSIVRLPRSARLAQCLAAISAAQAEQVQADRLLAQTPTPVLGRAYNRIQDPAYALVVSANNLAVDIDNELLLVHKFIRDHYAPHFPGLHTLVPDPPSYVRAVTALGNAADMTKVPLTGILPAATVMVIAVSASTIDGRQLTEAEWAQVQHAIAVEEQLESARKTVRLFIYLFVQLVATENLC